MPKTKVNNKHDPDVETDRDDLGVYKIHQTDLGNANRLIMRHGKNIRYVDQWKSWYVWNGHYWERSNQEIMRRAEDTVCRMLKEAARITDQLERKRLAQWALQSESKQRLHAMVDLAQFQSEVTATPNDFDANPWLINCRNCTVDLRTGETHEHRREDMLTSVLDFDYDPVAKCPKFFRFLDIIMDGNKNLIGFLQRAIGYSLTADIREEVMFIPWGEGNNGKSTLLNVVARLVGSYARVLSPNSLAGDIRRSGSAPSGDIAKLNGARFVQVNEADEEQRLNESLVKQLLSREKITASFKYQDEFEFAPTWKIWYSTNHKPEIRNTDTGIWRRIKLIPFNVRLLRKEDAGYDQAPEYLRIDTTIPDRLNAEISGILNWAIEGCLAWQKDGLGIPDEVTRETNTYRAEMDVIGRFLNECCVVTSAARVLRADLYKHYGEWCQENRETELKSSKFNGRLEERGFKRRNSDAGGAQRWHGVRLKTDTDLSSVSTPISSVNDPATDETAKTSVATNSEFKCIHDTLLTITDGTDHSKSNSSLESPCKEKSSKKRSVSSVASANTPQTPMNSGFPSTDKTSVNVSTDETTDEPSVTQLSFFDEKVA